MHKCTSAKCTNAQMHEYTNAKCTSAKYINTNAKCTNDPPPPATVVWPYLYVHKHLNRQHFPSQVFPPRSLVVPYNTAPVSVSRERLEHAENALRVSKLTTEDQKVKIEKLQAKNKEYKDRLDSIADERTRKAATKYVFCDVVTNQWQRQWQWQWQHGT